MSLFIHSWQRPFAAERFCINNYIPLKLNHKCRVQIMHQPYQRCRLNERSVVASGAFKYRYIHGHCPVVCALHENKLIKCDVLLLNYFRNAQYFSLSFVDQKSPQFDYKHLPFIIQDLQQRKMTREWLKVSKGKSIQ